MRFTKENDYPQCNSTAIPYASRANVARRDEERAAGSGKFTSV